MYTQARFFIRTALAYLLAAFVVGGVILANQGLAFDGRIGALLPVFYHLLMVGWVTQLIFGVALWMFPPLSREQPRGDERLGWCTYAALNAGLLLRAIGEPLYAWLSAPWLGGHWRCRRCSRCWRAGRSSSRSGRESRPARRNDERSTVEELLSVHRSSFGRDSMPRLSQLMIRTALVWLALGSTVGGLVLFNKGMPLLPWLWTLRAAHIHILLVGWTVQLACGVAFWILPRLDAGGSRGDERPVWLCYGTLNAGVMLGALYVPIASIVALAAGGVAYIVVGGLYLITAVAFFVHTWPRIAPFRTLPRPEPIASDQGE